METIHSPLCYELEKEGKSFTLSIPVISFTPVTDESIKQDEMDLRLDKYNNNQQCKQMRINNNYQKTTSTTKPTDSQNSDASLPDRLRELRKCLTWIHSEMVNDLYILLSVCT